MGARVAGASSQTLARRAASRSFPGMPCWGPSGPGRTGLDGAFLRCVLTGRASLRGDPARSEGAHGLRGTLSGPCLNLSLAPD